MGGYLLIYASARESGKNTKPQLRKKANANGSGERQEAGDKKAEKKV